LKEKRMHLLRRKKNNGGDSPQRIPIAGKRKSEELLSQLENVNPTKRVAQSQLSNLRFVLEEFDMEVEYRIREMEKDAARAVLSLETNLHLELTKLPLNIRKITMKEFFSSETHLNSTVKKDIHNILNSVNVTPFSTPRITSRIKQQVPPNKNDITIDFGNDVIAIGDTSSKDARAQARAKLEAFQAQLLAAMQKVQSPLQTNLK